MPGWSTQRLPTSASGGCVEQHTLPIGAFFKSLVVPVLLLALFIAIIVQCFKVIGRRTKVEAAKSFAGGILYWAMGVSLFTHCVSFWSIVYFDQMAVIWYWLLAVISRIACDESTDAAPAASRENPESWAREDESTMPAQEMAVG